MLGYDIFHENILNRLIDNVRHNNNAASYIFEGPRGLHKSDAALLFAKALVCENTSVAPCCSCLACREAQSQNHPDIILVKPEKDKKTIGVDPIRALISECGARPFSEKHKVFIIKDGDILTPEAQNALLKVLEEPPEYAVFIIVCSDSEILLETVRSRSVTVTFPPVGADVVKRYIENKYPDEPRQDFLVRYCEGIPTAADDIVSRDDLELLREDSLNLIPKLLSEKKLYAFVLSDYFDEHKAEAEMVTDMMLMYLRDTLALIAGCKNNVVNTDKLDKLDILAKKYSPALIAVAADELITAKKMLEKHIKPSAVIMHAALKVKL